MNPHPGRAQISINPLTPKQLRDAETDKVYIINVGPREHRGIMAANKLWTIPSRGIAEYGVLEIPGVVYFQGLKKVDGMDVEFEWIAADGLDVAKDIIGTAPMKDPSESLIPLGVFISTSPIPSLDQLETAKDRWLQRCEEKVAEGDQLAALNGGVVDIGGGRTASNISRDHREALEELGLKRAWSGKNPRMVECENCGTANMPFASRCKGCQAVFDEEKDRKLFPRDYTNIPPISETEPRRGPGRPKKEEVAA